MPKTTIICWPACQLLMEEEGFRQNSALCSSNEYYEKYGDSAYAVNDEWLESLDADMVNKVCSLQESYEGPEVDFDPDEEFMII